METTVVNLNDYVAPQFGGGLLVRIDRRTKWGNPFRIGQDGERAEVNREIPAMAVGKNPARGAGPPRTRRPARLRARLPLPSPPVPRRRTRARRRVGRQVSRRDAQRSGAQRAWLRSSRIQSSPRLRTTQPLKGSER